MIICYPWRTEKAAAKRVTSMTVPADVNSLNSQHTDNKLIRGSARGSAFRQSLDAGERLPRIRSIAAAQTEYNCDGIFSVFPRPLILPLSIYENAETVLPRTNDVTTFLRLDQSGLSRSDRARLSPLIITVIESHKFAKFSLSSYPLDGVVVITGEITDTEK